MVDFKNEDKKINFIIDTLCSIGFEHKGASYAVHMLAYEIANRGHNVYIFNEPFYKHENITQIKTERIAQDDGWRGQFSWEGFSYPLDKTVSIYTQNTWGNPFNTTHNARWILHDYSQDQWDTYGKEDVIYNYASFKVPENTKQEKLTVLDYNEEKFSNLNRPSRKGFCHFIHKFTPEWGYEYLKNFGSFDVSNWNQNGGFEYLQQIFNEYEYMLTFDNKTYVSIIATLCGCKVILLNPDESITPLDFRVMNPIQMFGIAYGWGDIGWANKTIDLCRDNVENLKKSDKLSLDKLIKYWENKLFTTK
jgi:hypothetical protein